MLDGRPFKLNLISSLAGEKLAWNAPKDRALLALQEYYPVDFGYDVRAWLEYMVDNDAEFVNELHELFGVKFDLSVYKSALLTFEGFDNLLTLGYEIRTAKPDQD